MSGKSISKYLPGLLYFFYIFFLASVICTWNAITSMSIGLIFITGLVRKKLDGERLFNKQDITSFSIGCTLLFLLQFTSLLYTENLKEGFENIQLKSALVFVPLALHFSDFLDNRSFKKLMKYFIAILFFASIYCLVFSLSDYLKNHDGSVFFYHKLVTPIVQHAIQFSILVFIALVHLLEEARKGIYHFNTAIHAAVTLFFVGLLLLLSSKLIIAIFFLYLIYYFLISVRKVARNRFAIPISILACLIIALILVFTRNPVTNRFNEIMAGNVQLVEKDKFNPGIYFNGLQFRLLQWRFVRELLNENHAWLTGLAPADTQAALDQKYISANMYIGEASRGDRGFLGYNTHNQFLESLLQTGIPGLLSFFLICFGIIRMALKAGKRELSVLTILLLAYALNESVFETEYGSMIFLFFPLFLYRGLKKRDQLHSPGVDNR